MMYSEEYLKYLKKEKACTDITAKAYIADVEEFGAFLSRRHKEYTSAGNAEVAAFLLKLKDNGKSPSTINRKLASLRSFYGFLRNQKIVSEDPTAGIKRPRIYRTTVEYLTIEETNMLLSAPDDSMKGKRDRALLELMYATGLRASEVCLANIDDIDFRIGFISTHPENGKARMIPIGRPARAALTEYVSGGARKALIGKKRDEGALFVNAQGERITRQGIWKVLKQYGEKVELESKISPQILRNSFAAHMIQNGADIKSLQELLGHEDITATKLFLSLSKNRIMDVYDKAFPRA